MTILWPHKLLPPQTPRPHYLSHMNISGPVSQTSLSDVIAGDAGFWRASYGTIIVTNPQRVQTWNAIRALLSGRLNPILVPYCGRLYQPIPSDYSGLPVPHDDDTFFDDGSGYVSDGTKVILQTDIPVRGVSCIVDVIVAGTIQPGHVFSIGERMFEIRAITDIGGASRQISFMPPAREAVLAGAELNFTTPVCRMRLATDEAMSVDLDINRRGFPSVDFVEDLTP